MSAITATILLLGGCSGTPPCQEPQPYESSRLGKHVEVPDGLDPLAAGREMTIPEPSPRPPRSSSAPCLEYPPSFHTSEEMPAPEESL